jgi:ProP effector
LGAIGFEQLAELKEQRALKEQLAKRTEPKPVTRPPRARRPAPAINAKPVDPVVVTIGKLQKRFPNAFPRNPSPKGFRSRSESLRIWLYTLPSYR